MSQYNDPLLVEERKRVFNKWFARVAPELGYHKLPAQLQGRVHLMMWRAFRRGVQHEFTSQQPTQVGGVD